MELYRVNIFLSVRGIEESHALDFANGRFFHSWPAGEWGSVGAGCLRWTKG